MGEEDVRPGSHGLGEAHVEQQPAEFRERDPGFIASQVANVREIGTVVAHGALLGASALRAADPSHPGSAAGNGVAGVAAGDSRRSPQGEANRTRD